MDENDLKELLELKKKKDYELSKINITEMPKEVKPAEEAKPEPEPEPERPLEIKGPKHARPLTEEEESDKKTDEKCSTRTRHFTPVSGELGSRAERHRSQEQEKKMAKKKKNKTLTVILICAAAALVLIAAVILVFLNVRKNNMTKWSYPFWGEGIGIKNGTERYSFTGKLLEIRQYDEIDQVRALAEFNKDGNCVKETAYDATLAVDSYYVHTYDENGVRIRTDFFQYGQLIRKTVYTVLDESTVLAETSLLQNDGKTEQYSLKLDENKNLLIKTLLEDGQRVRSETYRGTLVTISEVFLPVASKTVYEYDDKDNLTVTTVYNASGAIVSRNVSEYNSANLISKTIDYDGKGTIVSYHTYNYDNKGNPVKIADYGSDGKMTGQTICTYNEKNRLTKETKSTASGLILSCKGYEYDDKGFMTKEIVYSNNNVSMVESYVVYIRSADGNISSTENYDSNRVITAKQIFDEEGYPTEKHVYENGAIQTKNYYVYDASHNLLKEDFYGYDLSGNPQEHTCSEYGSDRLLQQFTTENLLSGTYVRTSYFYTNRVLTQERSYNREGVITESIDYNADGQVLSDTAYVNGEEGITEQYTYNEDGTVATKLEYDPASRTATKHSYTYENGIAVSEEETVNNVHTATRQLNPDGTAATEMLYIDETVTKITEFIYDESGRVIVAQEYDAEYVPGNKTVYYYRDTGAFEYRIYDADGTLIFDTTAGNLDYEWPEDEFTDDDPTEEGPSEEPPLAE